MTTAIGSTATTGTTGTTSTSSAPISRAAGGALGKDQFLQLLVAQMKHQDPLNPMDGQQMAAQLAQFSSVEQLTQINENLSTQSSGQAALATLLANNGAFGAVGKTVVVAANRVDTSNGAPAAVLADVPAGARTATLRVYDERGTEVASQSLGGVSEGRRTFTLSGAAKTMKGGTYSYVVETTDAAGTTTSQAPTYVTGRVDGVRFTSVGPVVTIGGIAVPYMAVTELSN